MATRSTISVKGDDGNVHSVYCHSDGYVEHNGLMLFTYHRSWAAAKALVGLGSLSYISSEGEVIAYHRNRGDRWENVKPRVNERIWEAWADQFEKFGYYHDGEQWLWAPDPAAKPFPLRDTLVKLGLIQPARPRTRIVVPKPQRRALIL